MSERALVFGQAADAYERFRLGYPVEVADLTLAYARAPVTRALEVGAGTGKATPLFAGRGIHVTACEPDAAMTAVLRRTTAGLPVEVVVSTFEAYAPGEPYDLLFAASAWHWTDPAERWDRTARFVRPGGTVALFGSGGPGSQLVDPDVRAAVNAVRREVLPDETRLTEGQSGSGTWWPGSELEDDPRFTDVEEHDLRRVVRRTRAAHVALLGTLSNYLQLDEGVRTDLLDRIGAVLPDEVAVNADVRLHLARRVADWTTPRPPEWTPTSSRPFDRLRERSTGSESVRQAQRAFDELGGRSIRRTGAGRTSRPAPRSSR